MAASLRRRFRHKPLTHAEAEADADADVDANSGDDNDKGDGDDRERERLQPQVAQLKRCQVELLLFWFLVVVAC